MQKQIWKLSKPTLHITDEPDINKWFDGYPFLPLSLCMLGPLAAMFCFSQGMDLADSAHKIIHIFKNIGEHKKETDEKHG